MTEIVFAIPVLPGKEELDRQTFDEMAESRRDEYAAALTEAGISRKPFGTRKRRTARLLSFTSRRTAQTPLSASRHPTPRSAACSASGCRRSTAWMSLSRLRQ